jgi:hypothetical protein
MSSIDVSSEAWTRIHESRTADMRLETVVVPVSDVDRARVAR